VREGQAQKHEEGALSSVQKRGDAALPAAAPRAAGGVIMQSFEKQSQLNILDVLVLALILDVQHTAHPAPTFLCDSGYPARVGPHLALLLVGFLVVDVESGLLALPLNGRVALLPDFFRLVVAGLAASSLIDAQSHVLASRFRPFYF